MRVVFTIYYNLDSNLYIIYDDKMTRRSIFEIGKLTFNELLVYFIVYVSYYDFEKVYIYRDVWFTQYMITSDYRKYVDKRGCRLL